MANAIYPKWKEALLQASSDSALTGTAAGDYESYTNFDGVIIMGAQV